MQTNTAAKELRVGDRVAPTDEANEPLWTGKVGRVVATGLGLPFDPWVAVKFKGQRKPVPFYPRHLMVQIGLTDDLPRAAGNPNTLPNTGEPAAAQRSWMERLMDEALANPPWAPNYAEHTRIMCKADPEFDHVIGDYIKRIDGAWDWPTVLPGPREAHYLYTPDGWIIDLPTAQDGQTQEVLQQQLNGLIKLATIQHERINSQQQAIHTLAGMLERTAQAALAIVEAAGIVEIMTSRGLVNVRSDLTEVYEAARDAAADAFVDQNTAPLSDDEP